MPQHESRNLAPVDRAARDQAAKWIRQWLHGEISGVELEQALEVLSLRSHDRTLPPICRIMADYHSISFSGGAGLDEPTWRHVQRLLLLLASDWHIQEYVDNGTRLALAFTGVCLMLCLGAGWYFFGASREFAIVWIGSGLISAVLTWLVIDRSVASISDSYPFTSEEEMQLVARSAPQFQHEPVPDTTAQPAVRETPSLASRVDDMWHWGSVCLVAAPFMLLLLFAAIRSYRGTTLRVVPPLRS